MHPIDKAWEEHQGKYGVTFLDESITKKCLHCKKEFKTKLQHMKYCSITCHPSLGAKIDL